MKDYLKLFASVANYDTWKSSENYIEPSVSHTLDNDIVHYQPVAKNASHNNYDDYLTFEAIEDTTFKFTKNALQYSLDDGDTWTTLAAETASPTVTTGNKILWKQTGLTPNEEGIGHFSSTGQFNVSGNIMSLHYGDNFVNKADLTDKNYAFYELFQYCSKLVNAENLILPATTLSRACYTSMFYECTSLTTAPELPATTSAYGCYSSMFADCTSLTTAPELPATTLATYCYSSMFLGCTSLTSAPELPATTLAEGCYYYMFKDCSLLTSAPELPATTLANNCYYNMFKNCTSLTTAPELPATTLATGCYRDMFNGCTSLNYIKCLATTNTSADYATSNWVAGVSSSGTFVKDASMGSWSTGINGIPTGWTVQNAA